MKRGRPRKPTAQLKLHGTYNTTRHDGVVEAPPGVPNPPSWLDKEAKAEWKRVVPVLGRLGLLSNIDRAQLAEMCKNWSIFHRLSKVFDGLIAKGEFSVEFSRVSTALQSAINAHSRAAAQFGLTPSARAGLRPGLSGAAADASDDEAAASAAFGF